MRKLIFAAAVALACYGAPSQADDERSCEIVAAAAQLSGKTNCREGDIATISGMSTKDLPVAVARYCDFWGADRRTARCGRNRCIGPHCSLQIPSARGSPSSLGDAIAPPLPCRKCSGRPSEDRNQTGQRQLPDEGSIKEMEKLK